ncbi:MAG: hypothetical protein JXR84_28535 [Anaerolineae bacterium]|nr:hypothetical protein [Anaerolineae bacterium]
MNINNDENESRASSITLQVQAFPFDSPLAEPETARERLTFCQALQPHTAPMSQAGCQVLNHLDPKVQEICWQCRVWGTVQRLFAQPGFKLPDTLQDIADLFEVTPPSWKNGEARRLRHIYRHTLRPRIRQHFSLAQAAALERYIQRLIVLRWLDVPYKGTRDPHLLSQLLSLHTLCQGHDLMVWVEGETPVFVVENRRKAFIAWMMQRMQAFLGYAERDKTLADALWTAWFTTPDFGSVSERTLPLPAGAESLHVSGEAFPGREAILIRAGEVPPRVVIFESPWELDQGRRVRAAMPQIPAGIPPSRVWVWEPARLTPGQAQTVLAYMTTGRALRYALLQKGYEQAAPRLVNVLKHYYLEASSSAIHHLVQCYQNGQIVTDDGVYPPPAESPDMLHSLAQVFATATGREIQKK